MWILVKKSGYRIIGKNVFQTDMDTFHTKVVFLNLYAILIAFMKLEKTYCFCELIFYLSYLIIYLLY